MRVNPTFGGSVSAAVGPERGAAGAPVSVPATSAGPISAGDADAAGLSAASSRGETAPVTLADLAQLLGLPDDQEWRAVLAALVRDALPLTRALAERTLALWRQSGLPQPDAAALLWLARRDLAPLPERVALLRAFRRAHPEPAGPPDDALMVAAHIARGAPLRLHVWSAAPDEEPSRSPASGRPDESVPKAASASADARRAAARQGRPVVVLLSVETAHLGETEALIELIDGSVAVTCFSESADAVAALAAGLDRLRAALAAAGLTPTSLAALSAAPGLDEEQRLRRIDARL